MNNKMERPLRVLMVMHMSASLDKGGPRVQLELADEFRAHGCEVKVLARDEILGGPSVNRLGLSALAFAVMAIRHVRKIAHNYDVIDAHQGNLPVSKERLGFDGLAVTRSAGLTPLHAEFNATAQRRWPHAARGHVLARLPRRLQRRRALKRAITTYQLCDLINVPNIDEYTYLAKRLGLGHKTVVLPNGLSEILMTQLHTTTVNRAKTGPRVAFIGYWCPGKGSQDWPEIARRVRQRQPKASFLFLGTHTATAELVSSLGVPHCCVDVVASYPSRALSRLLADVRVGAFPSYVEGFGLGVLEKMAAGIPSVCYDVPGPRETIGRVDSSLLVPAGDTKALAGRLVELLEMDDLTYSRLSARCRAVAEQFSWRLIGEETLAVYQERLQALRDASQDAECL